MAVVDEFFQEFDSATVDVQQTDFNMFDTNLERWFEVIEEYPEAEAICRRLESGHDFAAKFSEDGRAENLRGSASLVWPRGRDARLGMQIAAIRAFRNDAVNVVDVYNTYFRGSSDYQDKCDEIVAQIFKPTARDLRRQFEKIFSDSVSIPASDRVVQLNHNSREFQTAEEALEQIERAVVQLNTAMDHDEKEQRLYEIQASRTVLKAGSARESVVISLIYKCMKYIMLRFSDTAIGRLAEIVLAALGKLTGLW